MVDGGRGQRVADAAPSMTDAHDETHDGPDRHVLLVFVALRPGYGRVAQRGELAPRAEPAPADRLIPKVGKQAWRDRACRDDFLVQKIPAQVARHVPVLAHRQDRALALAG